MLVEGPAGSELLGGVLADDPLDGVSHRAVAGRHDDNVCLLEVTVGELKAVLMDADDLLALLDLDLAVSDELGATDVEVVAATVSEVLHEETAVVPVELEADLLETVEDVLVELSHLLGRFEVELADQFDWKGGEEDVGIVYGRAALLVEAVEPRWQTVLGGDDVGGGSLDDCGVGAMLVEFAV